MKAKVLSVQERKSKNGNVYNKALVSFADGVCGFVYDKDCVCVAGGEVEVGFDTDFNSNLTARVWPLNK